MPDVLAGFLTFVGRVAELEVLDAALDTARRGEGSVVLVAGEAGIGKTRLCREVAARARQAGFAVGWGSCWPEGGAPPLWPWQAVLHDLGQAAAGALLDGDRGGTSVDPERFARFAGVADLLAAGCAEAPALVVIDDAHAADAGTLLLTRFVARRLATAPLALVLACRAGRPLAGDVRADATVTMGPFDLAETAQFLRSHEHPDLDERLLQTLHQVTGGHPLLLQRVAGNGAPATATQPAPGGVRAAIVAAATRLSEPALGILRRAAVLGSSPAIEDTAEIGGVPSVAVHRALREAEPAGLVIVPDRSRFSFGHELVREVLVEQLTEEEETEVHARAAEMLTPGSGASGAGQLTRHAHHALRAATRSVADARRAVAACRVAAHAMIGGFAYEQAGSLLAAATGVHERARLTEPVAPVVVEWAEAVLRCGRLTEARRLFDRAAKLATAERDPVMLARAALGLGGVWVNEHRTTLEWERVAGLQRRALAGLPAGEQALRHRLTVRLAAEEVYRGGPVEPVLAALAAARRLGDGRALAEALSLCHHAMLTPAHVRSRRALAEELIAVASQAGEEMLALLGLCWRTVDLFHLADPEADRSLVELRERADALGCLSVLYVAEAMEVMGLIRAGRLDQAEAAANACYELGVRVGDADAAGYLGAHLTTIRWLQGRDAEMLPAIEQLAGSPTLNPADFAFQATAASLAARAGEHELARAVLDRLTEPGLAALPESSTWLAGLLAIVEAAQVLRDVRLARQAYQLLEPYADLPVRPSLAVTCFGSVERALGLAAATFGELDRAVAHLDRAVNANRLLGNRPVTAISRADLAEALLARAGTGDRELALNHLTQARAEAEALDLPVRAAAWGARLDGVASWDATIRRERRHWTVTVGGQRAVVPDLLGMRYLAQLVTNPGQRIRALELVGGPAGSATAAPAGQVVTDQRARAAYRRRAEELTERLAQADRRGDPVQSQLARGELDALLGELRRGTGRGGRSRTFPDPGERARTAVRKAIKRAIDEITTSQPPVGDLLRTTITTGATCCYTPEAARPVRWRYADDR